MLGNLLKNKHKKPNTRYVNERSISRSLQHALLKVIGDQPGYVKTHGFASQSYKNFIARFYDLASAENLSLLSLPSYQQSQDYTCGPAIIMSLLAYYGMLSPQDLTPETELRIATEIGSCKDKGTTPEQIGAWLQANGFTVEIGQNGTLDMLRDNLAKGHPTLVEWMDWGGHWSIATGYNKAADAQHDTLFLGDPSAKYNCEKTINGMIQVSAQRFKSMWFDAQYFNPGHIVKGIYLTAVPKGL